MSEFGPGQAKGKRTRQGGFGTGVVKSANHGNFAGTPRPVDDPGQWAHRFSPARLTTRAGGCPEGCAFEGGHVHDRSGVVRRVDSDGRWAEKPLREDGAP